MYGDPPEKLAHRIPVFKVTQGHWKCHGSIRHLSVIHSNTNYGPISPSFRDERRQFRSKNISFSYFLYSVSRLRALPVEFSNGVWIYTRMRLYQMVIKLWLLVQLFRHNLSIGRTDRTDRNINRNVLADISPGPLSRKVLLHYSIRNELQLSRDRVRDRRKLVWTFRLLFHLLSKLHHLGEIRLFITESYIELLGPGWKYPRSPMQIMNTHARVRAYEQFSCLYWDKKN